MNHKRDANEVIYVSSKVAEEGIRITWLRKENIIYALSQYVLLTVMITGDLTFNLNDQSHFCFDI